MVEIIEVKDSIQDTINSFSSINKDLSDIEDVMVKLDNLLAQDLWYGDAKDKCVEIHGLLHEYRKNITYLFNQLENETNQLHKNMIDFPIDSDCLRIIRGI